MSDFTYSRDIKRVIRQYHQQLNPNKFNNSYEIYKSLKDTKISYQTTKAHLSSTLDNLNSPISIKEVEFVVINPLKENCRSK